MIIRPVEPSDAAAWESMRRDLWPESEPEAVLLALEGSKLVAFAELSIRQELPRKRVGYIEGLYVAPPFRYRGIAKKLLETSRLWARSSGCEAFASARSERIVIDSRF